MKPALRVLEMGHGAWSMCAVLAMLLEPAAQHVGIHAVRCRDGGNGCAGDLLESLQFRLELSTLAATRVRVRRR